MLRDALRKLEIVVDAENRTSPAFDEASGSVENFGDKVSKADEILKEFRKRGQDIVNSYKEIVKSGKEVNSTQEETNNIADRLCDTLDKGVDKVGEFAQGFIDASFVITMVGGAIFQAYEGIKKLFEITEKMATQFQLDKSMDAFAKSVNVGTEELLNWGDAIDDTVPKTELLTSLWATTTGESEKFTQSLAEGNETLLTLSKAISTTNPLLGDTLTVWESLVEGIKNGNPELLRVVGLSSDMTQAQEDFADSIGKTVDELDDEEVALATLNGVLETAVTNMEDLEEAAENAVDPWSRLRSEIKNVKDELFDAEDATEGFGKVWSIVADMVGVFGDELARENTFDKLNKELQELGYNTRDFSAEWIELQNAAGFIRNTEDAVALLAEMQYILTLLTPGLKDSGEAMAGQSGIVQGYIGYIQGATSATYDLTEAQLFMSGIKGDVISVMRDMNLEAWEEQAAMDALLIATGELTQEEINLRGAKEILIQRFIDGKLSAEELKDAFDELEDSTADSALEAQNLAKWLAAIAGYGTLNPQIVLDVLVNYSEVGGGIRQPGWVINPPEMTGDKSMPPGAVRGTEVYDNELDATYMHWVDANGNTVRYVFLRNGRATGGSVQGGSPYVVGEGGAEVFVPEQSGQVVTYEDAVRSLRDQYQTVSSPYRTTIGDFNDLYNLILRISQTVDQVNQTSYASFETYLMMSEYQEQITEYMANIPELLKQIDDLLINGDLTLKETEKLTELQSMLVDLNEIMVEELGDLNQWMQEAEPTRKELIDKTIQQWATQMGDSSNFSQWQRMGDAGDYVKARYGHEKGNYGFYKDEYGKTRLVFEGVPGWEDIVNACQAIETWIPYFGLNGMQVKWDANIMSRVPYRAKGAYPQPYFADPFSAFTAPSWVFEDMEASPYVLRELDKLAWELENGYLSLGRTEEYFKRTEVYFKLWTLQEQERFAMEADYWMRWNQAQEELLRWMNSVIGEWSISDIEAVIQSLEAQYGVDLRTSPPANPEIPRGGYRYLNRAELEAMGIDVDNWTPPPGYVVVEPDDPMATTTPPAVTYLQGMAAGGATMSKSDLFKRPQIGSAVASYAQPSMSYGGFGIPVGEGGMEWFAPAMAGRILSNSDLMTAIRTSEQGNVYNFYFTVTTPVNVADKEWVERELSPYIRKAVREAER